jgi:hypothetical protein
VAFSAFIPSPFYSRILVIPIRLSQPPQLNQRALGRTGLNYANRTKTKSNVDAGCRGDAGGTAAEDARQEPAVELRMKVGILPRIFARIVSPISRLLHWALRRIGHVMASDVLQALQVISTVALLEHNEQIVKQHRNPLNKCGRKVFSQADEDGITCEIIKRIGIKCGVFAEFGVGNGLENNTIVLASLGWKGFWVGAESLAYDLLPAPLTGQQRDFAFIREFIDTENILSFARRGLESISEDKVDVVSLDLDGNDIYFVEELLKGGFLPKLFIVEYNAKFIPPIRWKIEYNPAHRWVGDDYFGASLMEFNDLFEKYRYSLVCCNSATGANAFFVQSSYRDVFHDVPADINVLWSPPLYFTGEYGHPVSAKTVALIMNNIASVRSRHFT